MKNKLTILLFILTYNLSVAQQLYTENFNSYPTGNVGTDTTGTTPGLGGWYTKGSISTSQNSDFQIVTNPTNGKIFQLTGGTSWTGHRSLYRTDLNTIFANRNTNNKVFKISFDYYASDTSNHLSATEYIVISNNKERLVGIVIPGGSKAIAGGLATSRNQQHYPLGVRFLDPKDVSKNLELPRNVWYTIEIYLDYNTSKVYFSIPALNYTIVKNSYFTLELNGTQHNDTPFEFKVEKNDSAAGYRMFLKIDNITFSAQSTPPVVTLGLDEILNEKFTVYPNPATNVVNFTNTDNIAVTNVKIYDVSGKLLKTITNVENNAINIESLATGTYLLHLKTNIGTAVKKIVKN